MNTNQLHPDDYKYIVKDAANFNPDRNRALIAQTIQEAEGRMKKVQEAVDHSLGERIEAVAHYGAYRFNRGTKKLKEYLGPKLWEKYIGEKLLEKIKVMRTANKLAGNDKFETSVLL